LGNAGCYPGERPQGVPLVLYCCGFVQKLVERKPILFIVYVLLVSVSLTQGSRTSKPPKRKAILTKVPQKGQLIFLEKLKKCESHRRLGLILGRFLLIMTVSISR
jgi:hypothetical protein